MGIRGLTTFIENRSHLYLENYQLHDTNLVIDGNSIACQLYRRHNFLNDCFGGDYDIFAGVINNFFNILQRCNVTPLIVFDGGYETRKVHTIFSRMRSRIKTANKLNPTNNLSVFPLFQRHVFEDVVTQRGIKSVRCDFEGDTEITNIAKALDCPILSYDSDFFIFDALYIPFAYFEISVKSTKDEANATYKYISCKVYYVNKFLKSFPGLQKSSLPILAVLLGNDYIRKSVFAVFYQNLKMQSCRGSDSNQQKVIKSLLTWLQNETIESALSKVLGRYCKARRQKILKKIHVAINGYNSYESKYMRYLDVKVPKLDQSKPNLDLLTINISDEEIEKNDTSPDQEDDVSSEEDEDENVNIPSNFQDKYRRCIYPASFMDISVRNRYYCVPQVEDFALENSHIISFDILSAIHKILSNKSENLICIGRKNTENVGKYAVPLCDMSLPDFNKISSMSKTSKIDCICKILDIGIDLNWLNSFPDSWHIFILTIYFYSKKNCTNLSLVYSLIMCKLILSYVDKKVGFYRSSKTFNKKFEPFLNDHKSTPNPNNPQLNDIQSAVDNISRNDSISGLNALVSYFEKKSKLATNYKAFDRQLVHTISQFQSCLLHINYLNTLFEFPFPRLFVQDLLNCTFVYNLSANLSKRTNMNEYLKVLLKDAPSFLHCCQAIVNSITSNITFETNPQVSAKKRRKKRKKREDQPENIDDILKIDDLEINSDDEASFDPNNIFSVLRNN